MRRRSFTNDKYQVLIYQSIDNSSIDIFQSNQPCFQRKPNNQDYLINQ